MQKILLSLLVITLLLTSVTATTIVERWSGNVNAKNMEVKSLWIRDIVDLWDENIIKSTNIINTKAVYAVTEDSEIYEGSAKANGEITIEGGKVTYRVIDFKPAYTEIDESRTLIEGNAIVEYTITIKKQMPVRASFWFDQYDDEKQGLVEFSSEDMTFEAEGADFKMTVNN